MSLPRHFGILYFNVRTLKADRTLNFKFEVKGQNGFSVHTNDLLQMMIDTAPLISLSPSSAVSITNKK